MIVAIRTALATHTPIISTLRVERWEDEGFEVRFIYEVRPFSFLIPQFPRFKKLHY